MTVRYTLLCDNAKTPTYGTPYAAGADLYTVTDADVLPGQTVAFHTGVSVEIPEGYAGLVYARSGLSCKQGLAPANKVGVIDSDYRGEIIVFLHNHSSETRTVHAGDRIAQLVVTPFLHCDFEQTDTLSQTERGQGGFGSTGTK